MTREARDTRGARGAWDAYAAAAAAARVEVRELTHLAELEQATQVLARIWGVPGNPPLSTELLRALGKAESYVAGAYDRHDDREDDERGAAPMVGVCVGFHHAPATRSMHSHIAGVTAAVAGRHAGFALKLHQRAWCLDHGIESMEWTYDPLVARNAYFNLAKLGATVAEYLPDFYGPMADGINASDESDRLLVRWALASPEVVAACAGRPRRAEVPPGAAASWVAVPPDIEALRTDDPEQARGWRAKVRDQLTTALAAGARVAGFDKERGYLVLPHEGDRR
ncbi:MAG: GNAT family N-acetyltransferase [Nocardioides sp.]|uniref:GNAT family N-acetyltransferase n=1 Tax=Nocardioides sp. TaxID=35761 RepID=UPI0039E23939